MKTLLSNLFVRSGGNNRRRLLFAAAVALATFAIPAFFGTAVVLAVRSMLS